MFTDQQIAQFVIQNRNDPAAIRSAMQQTGVTTADVNRALEPIRQKAMQTGYAEDNTWRGGDIGQGGGVDPIELFNQLDYAGITIDPRNAEQVGSWLKMRGSQSAGQTQQLLAELWGGADKVPQTPAYHQAVNAGWEAAGQRDIQGNRDFLNKARMGAIAIGTMGALGGFDALAGTLDSTFGTVGLTGAGTTAGGLSSIPAGMTSQEYAASLIPGSDAAAAAALETAGTSAFEGLATTSSLQNAAITTLTAGGAMSAEAAAAKIANLTDAELLALPGVKAMVDSGVTPNGTSIIPGGKNNYVATPGGNGGGGSSGGGSSGGGSMTQSDLESWLKAFGPAFLGALGSYDMSQTYKDIAQSQIDAAKEWQGTLLGLYKDQVAKQDALRTQALNITQPSRDRYEASFAPGFTMSQDPGYTDMLNQGADTIMRALSVKGNPYGVPSSITAGMDWVDKNLAYPALQGYRTQNANTGGYAAFGSTAASLPGTVSLPTNSQVPGAGNDALMGSASQHGNIYNSFGSGLANLLTPQRQITGINPTTGQFIYSTL